MRDEGTSRSGSNAHDIVRTSTYVYKYKYIYILYTSLYHTNLQQGHKTTTSRDSVRVAAITFVQFPLLNSRPTQHGKCYSSIPPIQPLPVRESDQRYKCAFYAHCNMLSTPDATIIPYCCLLSMCTAVSIVYMLYVVKLLQWSGIVRGARETWRAARENKTRESHPLGNSACDPRSTQAHGRRTPQACLDRVGLPCSSQAPESLLTHR